jgi:hypothetical protein
LRASRPRRCSPRCGRARTGSEDHEDSATTYLSHRYQSRASGVSADRDQI